MHEEPPRALDSSPLDSSPLDSSDVQFDLADTRCAGAEPDPRPRVTVIRRDQLSELGCLEGLEGPGNGLFD